jgi:hypothetical protein
MAVQSTPPVPMHPPHDSMFSFVSMHSNVPFSPGIGHLVYSESPQGASRRTRLRAWPEAATVFAVTAGRDPVKSVTEVIMVGRNTYGRYRLAPGCKTRHRCDSSQSRPRQIGSPGQSLDLMGTRCTMLNPCYLSRFLSSSCSNSSRRKSIPQPCQNNLSKGRQCTYVIECSLRTLRARIAITSVGVRPRLALRWCFGHRRRALGPRGALRALVCRARRVRALPTGELVGGADWGICAVAWCNGLATSDVFGVLFCDRTRSVNQGVGKEYTGGTHCARTFRMDIAYIASRRVQSMRLLRMKRGSGHLGTSTLTCMSCSGW